MPYRVLPERLQCTLCGYITSRIVSPCPACNDGKPVGWSLPREDLSEPLTEDDFKRLA
jgi:hypothetical protein